MPSPSPSPEPDNIYITEDMGSHIWVNGECYIKTGLEAIAPDTSPAEVDEQGISGVSFNRDYSDPYHDTWTACQVCVAKHYNGLQGYYHIDEYESGHYGHLFTAPSNASGELRVWVGNPDATGSYEPGLYAEEDASTYIKSATESRFDHARAVRLDSGDPIYVGGESDDRGPLNNGSGEFDVRCWFLPDNHEPGNDYSDASPSPS